MKLTKLISNLNSDLAREYAHWHFYMHAAIVVQGLHREEIGEFLLNAAKSEMDHIKQWGDLILGLGAVPEFTPAPYKTDCVSPFDILKNALKMEEEVVSNYVIRMDEAADLQKNGGIERIHGRYVELFLENQILDSRSDVDNLKQLIKGEGEKFTM